MTFHDEEIVGLHHNKKRLTVTFHNQILELDGVEYWELTPFEWQNVIFEVKFFKIQDVPNHILAEYSWVKNYQKLVYLNLMEIDSSVGLRGVVVFENKSIKENIK